MRKLATIRKISDVSPIPNADRIEVVTVDGWAVVAKKGEFAVGDACVYFEIDSFLPVEDRYEFLRASSFRKMSYGDGFRLKTIRFRKQISQGLALPVSSFPELSFGVEHQDVTELLGVQLYEPPIPACLQGEIIGMFPSFMSKTDQERIQNIPEWFERYKDVTFETTVKLDGTSCTVYQKGDEFGVCGRNLNYIETEGNTYWKVANALNLRERMAKIGNFAIQGEIIGEGINKNNEEIRGQAFYLFDIFDIDKYKYLDPHQRAIVLAELNETGPEILTAPVIAIHKVLQEYPDVASILEFARGMSLNPKKSREGIVCKGRTEAQHIISFKVISNHYLLKHGE